MMADVIAMRVRDECEQLAFPWIEPEGLFGQLKTAMKADGNQSRTLNRAIPLVQQPHPMSHPAD